MLLYKYKNSRTFENFKNRQGKLYTDEGLKVL